MDARRRTRVRGRYTALNEIMDWMLETVSVTSSSKNSPWIPERYGHRTC